MLPNTPKLTDNELWELVRSNDKVAFSQLYKRYINGLYNFGKKHTFNNTLIKDTLQDLFTEIWSKRMHLNEVEHVKVYLIKSFRNKLIRALDKQYKSRTYSLEEIIDPKIDSVEIENKILLERRANLRKQLDKLPKRQREVIYLRYFQNLRNDEIAEIINVNYQSVSNLLHRALRNLRLNYKESSHFA